MLFGKVQRTVGASHQVGAVWLPSGCVALLLPRFFRRGNTNADRDNAVCDSPLMGQVKLEYGLEQALSYETATVPGGVGQQHGELFAAVPGYHLRWAQ